MSSDIVDDLHYAEDILAGAGALNGYCRPSCGYLDAHEDPQGNLDGLAPDEVCPDDTCGCPCGHPGSQLERFA